MIKNTWGYKDFLYRCNTKILYEATLTIRCLFGNKKDFSLLQHRELTS